MKIFSYKLNIFFKKKKIVAFFVLYFSGCLCEAKTLRVFVLGFVYFLWVFKRYFNATIAMYRTAEMYQAIENNVLKMFNGVKYHHECTKFKFIRLFSGLRVAWNCIIAY